MDSKAWWKSKSIWVSVASLVSAVAISLGLELSPTQSQALIFAILGVLGISLRDAIN